mgnify:CR=1 FL=1|jgi:hypothetical protein
MKKDIRPIHLFIFALVLLFGGMALGGEMGANLSLLGMLFAVIALISALRRKSKKDEPETSA